MKLKFFITIVTIIFLSNYSMAQNGNVGIGTTSPDSSAILDINSTSKGILIPRTEPNLITNPALGLTIFSLSDSIFYYYDGSDWLGLEHNIFKSENGEIRVADKYLLNNFLVGSKDAPTTMHIDTILHFRKDNSSFRVGSFVNDSIGLNSIAIGYRTNAIGNYSTAMGNLTNATNVFSTAMGYETHANGESSFATNHRTLANGKYSTSMGRRTRANGSFNLVIGKFNDTLITIQTQNDFSGDDNPLFIIGNGTGFSGVDSLSNAFVVRQDGRVEINEAYTLPIFDGSPGNILQTDGMGQLSWAGLLSIDSLNDLADVKVDYTNHNMIAGTGGQNMNANVVNNTSFGGIALRDINTGERNTAVGGLALYQTQSGSRNCGFGSYALAENVGGNNNVGIGEKALFSNTSNNNNTAIGAEAGSSNQGGNNVFIGYQAGKGTIPTSVLNGCVFIGNEAGKNETNNNVLIINNDDSLTPLVYGDFANDHFNINGKMGIGIDNSLPTHNLTIKSIDNNNLRLIGNSDSFGFGGKMNFGDGNHVYLHEYKDDSLRIQANAIGIRREATANTFELEGDASKTTAGNWSANSDRRIKTQIKTISNSFQIMKQLRPVKFKYTKEWMAMHPSIKDQYYYNFIAQEYATVFPESAKGSGEYIANDHKEILQIDTYNAGIVTIQAVKKLIDEHTLLKERLTKLESQMTDIMGQMAQK